VTIGWCAPATDTADVRSAGFDFIELPLAALAVSELPSPVFNQCLPRDLPIVGPHVDVARVKTYFARAAQVIQAAQAEAIVLGSGWARHIPEGFSRERAAEQFRQAIESLADATHATGPVIAIEAQNRKETNFITTLAEAVALAQAINDPLVRVIADTYHLLEEREGLDIVRQSSRWIAHVHVSDSSRLAPGRGTFDFDSFFRCLHECGYRGRLSLECMTKLPRAEMQRSGEFIRALWETTRR
jgi:sugar phosphate isomerase/epimerase